MSYFFKPNITHAVLGQYQMGDFYLFVYDPFGNKFGRDWT